MLNFFIKTSLVVFIMLVLSLSAEAARSSSSGIIVTANAYMYNTTTEVTPGSRTESTSSIYDFKLGYLSGSGIYLGGIYTLRRSEISNVVTDGNATGGSLGYVASSGIFLKGHYLASAEHGSYKEGTGYQVDLGYLSNVTGPLLIGVELTYRSLSYKKDTDSAGIDKVVKTELMPLLSLGFVF